jgi:hypothetical protein
MAEPVEVAIEKALLDRAIAFAAAQSPALTISLPNVAFTPPTPAPTAKWLRANFLPAPTAGLGVNVNSTNQHYGILQIDAVYGAGAGEYAPARIAAAVAAYFKFETQVTQDGFVARVWKPPYRGSLIKDDVWFFVPVSIPYVAFAPNPA